MFFALFNFLTANDNISEAYPLNNSFAFKTFKQIAADSDNNFNFAPLNLSLSLALAANGASGETQSEIIQVLGYETSNLKEANSYNQTLIKGFAQPLGDVELKLAQALWIDQQLILRDKFKNLNSIFYNADIRSLDLKDPLAPDHINRWIYKQTNGKIFSLVDEISQDVIMYMLSTFYFKGNWAVKFDQDNSKIRQFKARNNETKDLVFMKTKSDKIAYLEDKGFKAIGLPYGNGELTMYFFLPDEDSHIDLFLKSLNTSNWQKWMNSFQKEEVVAVVPRIELNSELTFNEILQDLGMKKAFTDKAEFGLLCNGGPLISEVKQKTFITINEEGTEAAAADKVVFKKGGSPSIYLTRPFVYALVDKRTEVILLMGVYQE
jgi:serpin B